MYKDSFPVLCWISIGIDNKQPKYFDKINSIYICGSCLSKSVYIRILLIFFVIIHISFIFIAKEFYFHHNDYIFNDSPYIMIVVISQKFETTNNEFEIYCKKSDLQLKLQNTFCLK